MQDVYFRQHEAAVRAKEFKAESKAKVKAMHAGDLRWFEKGEREPYVDFGDVVFMHGSGKLRVGALIHRFDDACSRVDFKQINVNRES